jgi:hypothetical protein
MSDSEKNDLTTAERELVVDVLTRAWLSINVRMKNDRREDRGELLTLPLSGQQKDMLATAIGKI